MAVFYVMAVLYLVSISFASGQDVDVNCTAVLADPPNFPLSFVNLCSQDEDKEILEETRQPRARRFMYCPPFECKNKCIMGWKKDRYGCPTCECAEEGKEGLFEADINIVGDMRIYMNANLEGAKGPKARGATKRLPLWQMYKSGKNYIVPYVVSSSIGSSGRSAITAAANDFAKYSCIRLQPRTNQGRYINFYRGGGCSSPVGAVSTRQDVSLASGCWYKGTVIHEVLHSLGFWHEQSRPDRDQYVRINYNNISPSVRYNFNKFSSNDIDSRSSPYDLGSVMHYNGYDFSSNGRATITDLNGKAVRAQRNGFSTEDIKQLNSLYGCSSTGGGGGTGTGGSCTDSNSNCAAWANRGECDKNPGYMLTNCCQSCKKGTGGNCENKQSSCDGWSRLGFCEGKYAPYMTKNCAKACNKC